MQKTATDVEKAMLTRLGTLSGLMEELAAAMFEMGVFDEWVELLQKETKKTDELVQLWSSM